MTPRLDEILAKAKLVGYQLPGNPETDRYAVGVSGGGDSTVLAILLKRLFPLQQIDFIFTDTLAEGEALYQNLDQLEVFLGINITRISHEKGLYGLIESYGGFLPSMKARYCTRDLKIRPYQAWVKSVLQEGQVLHSFVGLRADEEDRHGLVASGSQLQSHFPFKVLGVCREDVFTILQETVGVPTFYSHRTRSGCSICPFMRKTELLATLRSEPKAYDKAMACEKLSEEDMERYESRAIPVTMETRLASNHLTLPFPARVDARTSGSALPVVWPKSPKQSNKDSLFEGNKQVLWVGAEFFINAGVGDHGCTWQELVAISTTRGGLIRQMENHRLHRMHTPEAKWMTAEEMQDELKLAIYMVELPAGMVDVGRPATDSYTWQPGIALSQLKQMNDAVLRTLYVTGMDQETAEYDGDDELSWQYERREVLLVERAKITAPVGRVLAMDLLESRPATGPETELVPDVCLLANTQPEQLGLFA